MMHVDSALLVGHDSFMSMHWLSVRLSVNVSCSLHIPSSMEGLFKAMLKCSPYRDDVQNPYISPVQ